MEGLSEAIERISKEEQEKVHLILEGKSDGTIVWTPERKDILLFWLLKKVKELEGKLNYREVACSSAMPDDGLLSRYLFMGVTKEEEIIKEDDELTRRYKILKEEFDNREKEKEKEEEEELFEEVD